MTHEIFIRDLRLDASIGIHAHERAAPQPLIFNLCVCIAASASVSAPANITDTVCYEKLVTQIEAVLAEGHTDLVEQLADKITTRLFADTRIATIRLRIEKPNAIKTATSAGIEITHTRPAPR